MSDNKTSKMSSTELINPGSPPKDSFITAGIIPRRVSLTMPPEILQKKAQRRASLEKLQVEKVSPWMQLHDFTDEEKATEQ